MARASSSGIRIEAIVPKINHLSLAAARARTELMTTGHDVLRPLREEFDRITRTWTDAPAWKALVKFEGDALVISVSTKDKRFFWLNFGTKPHPIPLSKAGAFYFQSAFTPKTRPGWLGSVPGGKSGPYSLKLVPVLSHPGNEARDWTGILVKVYGTILKREAREAIRRMFR